MKKKVIFGVMALSIIAASTLLLSQKAVSSTSQLVNSQEPDCVTADDTCKGPNGLYFNYKNTAPSVPNDSKQAQPSF